MSKLPFVSGLPGNDLLPDRGADKIGLLALQGLRAWAAGRAEEARPRAQRRFVGDEALAADPDAVADLEACEQVVRLVDGILADALLSRRAALLMRRA